MKVQFKNYNYMDDADLMDSVDIDVENGKAILRNADILEDLNLDVISIGKGADYAVIDIGGEEGEGMFIFISENGV